MNGSITNNTEIFCDKTTHLLGFVGSQVLNNIGVISSGSLARLSEFNMKFSF